MSEKQSATRSIEVEVRIDAPPDAVWRALTEAEQLQSWFPLEARVRPGAGGSVWASWGGASTYESRIAVWEPPRHLRLVDQEADPEGGRPVQVAQDYFIEGRDGGTVLRFVHSGFSADAEWDDMYDAMSSGWRYFFFNLAHYVEKHAPARRTMVWVRQPFARGSRADDWAGVLRAFGIDPAAAPGDRFTLDLGGERLSGTVAQVNEPLHFAGTLPDLNDGLLFIEFERGSERWHLGFWLSTYGVEPDRVQALQARLDAAAGRLLVPAS